MLGSVPGETFYDQEGLSDTPFGVGSGGFDRNEVVVRERELEEKVTGFLLCEPFRYPESKLAILGRVGATANAHFGVNEISKPRRLILLAASDHQGTCRQGHPGCRTELLNALGIAELSVRYVPLCKRPVSFSLSSLVIEVVRMFARVSPDPHTLEGGSLWYGHRKWFSDQPMWRAPLSA